LSDITKAVFQLGNTDCWIIMRFRRRFAVKMPVNGLLWLMVAKAMGDILLDAQ
jgi:hypothetical protein